MDIKRALFIKKRQYLEVDYSSDDGINYLDLIALNLENGINIVQLNKFNGDDKSFLKLAKDLRQLTSLYSSLLIIKDRADIVQIVEADGILLDKKSVSLSDCKKVLGNYALFGVKSNQPNPDFDFCLSDKSVEIVEIPIFYKVKSEENIKIYRLEKFDVNK